MDYSVLERSTLFLGVTPAQLRKDLESVPHHIQCYEKAETVFYLMEEANRIGILLEGRVQAQKPFPNGSQINVSVMGPGELIGLAAAFSRKQKYPCDIVSLEPTTILMFRKDNLLSLLQKNIHVMQNFMTELATATYMLQQRVELLSYSGISQKASCYLLIQARQSGRKIIRIPDSVSNWAMIMNVSRSSLHRELKKLEDDGIISYHPPTIEIHDEEALQDVLTR